MKFSGYIGEADFFWVKVLNFCIEVGWGWGWGWGWEVRGYFNKIGIIFYKNIFCTFFGVC